MSEDRTQPIRRYLDLWTPRVDAELDRLLPRQDDEPVSVHRAMRYSVWAGGKRLRPALVLLGARAAGGDERSVLGLACAVECMHTYSLIHDDLPAMDDDDFRRGRPSCHREFGEAIAILAGDALNTLAFQLLAATTPRPAHAAELVDVLCRATGTYGMVGGQVADLEAEGAAPDLARVRAIHERKTAALLAASLLIGARGVADVPEELLGRLEAYGRRVGLAFQIVDDVLDEEGLRAEIGKTPGKDRQRGKMTYPAVVGTEESRSIAAEICREADALVLGLPATALLRSLTAFVVERRA